MHVKRRNLLAFIFSGACGSRRRGGPNPSFRQVAARKRRRLALSFSGFLRKRSSGFNLRKWRMIKARSGNTRWILRARFRRIIAKKRDFNLRKWRMIKARSGNTRWILRARFRRIIAKKRDVDETKKAQDVELCKMRILMGGKCRPLNPSGVLHYDEEGILLPEDVLF